MVVVSLAIESPHFLFEMSGIPSGIPFRSCGLWFFSCYHVNVSILSYIPVVAIARIIALIPVRRFIYPLTYLLIYLLIYLLLQYSI